MRAYSLLVIGSLALGGCCSAKTLSHTTVEAAIKDQASKQNLPMKSVTCPDGQAMKTGTKFDCTGVDSDGQTLVFHVNESDDKGSIVWKLDGMIINQEKVGDALEKKVGATADVQCPGKTVVLQVGQSFICNLLMNGKKQHITLTLTDTTGNVSYVVGP